MLVGLKPEQIFFAKHQKKRRELFYRQHMAKREANSWFSEDLQKRTKRSPLLTGISNRGQEQDVLLRQSVDDRPLGATFVCASFSIQRHVSKCFTPHIMLWMCPAHFDTDGALLSLERLLLVESLVMLYYWSQHETTLYTSVFWCISKWNKKFNETKCRTGLDFIHQVMIWWWKLSITYQNGGRWLDFVKRQRHKSTSHNILIKC